MFTPAEHTHHAIDYIEITVSDVAVAKTFYGAAFGWTFNDYGTIAKEPFAFPPRRTALSLRGPER